MKKWFLILMMIAVLATIASYVFIPAVIELSAIEKVNANSEEAFRYFTTDELRNKWVKTLTGNSNNNSGKTADSSFFFDSDSFTVGHPFATSVNISVGSTNNKINSQLLMVPQGVDSTIIVWEATINTGGNPISRIQHFLKAQKTKKQFTAILKHYGAFVSVSENVYPFPITTQRVKDTILITSRKVFSKTPGTTDIYNMANKLRNYAIANGATITNHPMLNITPLEAGNYQCTVALPVSKELKNNGDMYINKMVPGKILEEVVTGGPYTIKNAFNRLEDYYEQHRLVSPALPFELLVTDRSKETDTTKWVTKLYYPIM